jgi:membrane protein DedA with SNARE-associated domain
MDFWQLISDYGLLAVLVGTFLEGETILVLGGFFAQLGKLDLGLVMAAAFVGSLTGDQLWFAIGRLGGHWLLRRRPTWKPGFDRISSFLERNETWFVLTFRFYWGLRSISPFAIGMTGITWRRFALLNLIGAAVWAVCGALLGWGAGHLFPKDEAGKPDLHILMWVGIGALVLTIAVLLWRGLRGRRKATVVAPSALPGALPNPSETPGAP